MKRAREESAEQIVSGVRLIAMPNQAAVELTAGTIREQQKAAMIKALRWEMRQNQQLSVDFIERCMADPDTLESIDYLLDADE